MEITNLDIARGWLAAFIDGDGCVYSRNVKRPDGSVHSRRVVTIASTDKELIDVAAKACGDVDISDDCFAAIAGAEGIDAAELEGV